MIHGQPRPDINEAIPVEPHTLTRIARTLHDLPDWRKPACLFTDGDTYILVYTGGYEYPRYKTPRLTKEVYNSTSDSALERMMKCKALGDEVDYVIGRVS